MVWRNRYLFPAFCFNGQQFATPFEIRRFCHLTSPRGLYLNWQSSGGKFCYRLCLPIYDGISGNAARPAEQHQVRCSAG